MLRRDVCSYGYFLLAPNRWDPGRGVLSRPLDLPGGLAVVTIAQAGGRGGELRLAFDRRIAARERASAKRQVSRMLNLGDEGVAAFHRVDPRWKKSGRGRLFRSPTFFEDVVKTVTSCNVTWPSTMTMNRRLCEVINPAFPRGGQLARRRPATLRARCRVGYRDERLVELGKLETRGELEAGWFEDPSRSDEEVERRLLTLPGVGPYAAANIMQLLGRYGRVPIDTETYRHARVVLGYRGEGRALHERVERHYERFGAHKFRAYWFELWDFYESKRGPAWTWEADGAGRTFTAAHLS